MSILKNCEVCDKLFKVTPNRKDKAKFCSHICQGEAKRRTTVRRPMKPCERCKILFCPPKEKSRFCSPKCRSENSINKFETTCNWCGVKIQKIPCKINQKSFFCCWDHANKWSKRNQIILTCKICGKKFGVSKTGAKDRECCSFSCREKGVINGFEKKVYSLLDSFSINYLQQHPINKKFVVDAYVPDSNLIIQFDGDYWHGNPLLFPQPTNLQKKNINRDKSMDAYLTKCGYKILRFWESEFKNNQQMVVEKLKDNLNMV